MKNTIFLLFLCMTSSLQAQKAANTWCFGFTALLDFNTNPPTSDAHGCSMIAPEGCSSISDPATGKLLLYTNGVKVFDRNHNLMPAAITTPLHGDESSAQSALIVPQPGNSRYYYLFTTPGQVGLSTGISSMCYSIVDLSKNAGNGDLSSINNVLIDSSVEMVAAVATKCRASEYWIVGHGWNSDTFYAFKLTAAGLAPPVKSKAGMPQGTSDDLDRMHSVGCIKFSPDGKHLILVSLFALTVQLFDFDPETGIVSHTQTDIYIRGGAPDYVVELYGCSFSPDNSKFYVSGTMYNPIKGYVYQYDMGATDIMASRKLVVSCPGTCNAGSIQCGPDGKLYISMDFYTRIKQQIYVINNPNESAATGTLAFEMGNLLGGPQGMYSLPSFPENFVSITGDQPFTIPEQRTICIGDTVDAPQPARTDCSITPESYSVSADSLLVRFFPDSTTTYTIINTYECGSPDTQYLTIKVSPMPIAAFEITPTTPTLGDPFLMLTNQSLNGDHYVWFQDDKKVGNSIHCQIPNRDTGTFCYTLTAINAQNCQDTVTHCVRVLKSGISIPNAFTPNGDGNNDGFRALVSAPYISYKISIYNRYGEQIFSADKPEAAWDGTFKRQEEELGVYYYLVKVKFKGGEEKDEIYKGDVTLIR